jgi:hypothetical protein
MASAKISILFGEQRDSFQIDAAISPEKALELVRTHFGLNDMGYDLYTSSVGGIYTLLDKTKSLQEMVGRCLYLDTGILCFVYRLFCDNSF